MTRLKVYFCRQRHPAANRRLSRSTNYANSRGNRPRRIDIEQDRRGATSTMPMPNAKRGMLIFYAFAEFL
jgi:hypothetical protein